MTKEFFKSIWQYMREKKNCKHDWKHIGHEYSGMKEFFTSTGFREIYQCKECGKQKKELPEESWNHYTYF